MPAAPKQYTKQILPGNLLVVETIKSKNSDSYITLDNNQISLIGTDVYLQNQLSINPLKTDVDGKIIP